MKAWWPARKARRCRAFLAGFLSPLGRREFSRPADLPVAAFPRDDGGNVVGVVSILARLNGRALPGFEGVAADAAIVSILARLNGRALLILPGSPGGADGVSILARLNGRALPPGLTPIPVCRLFQSSPGLMAGRYLDARVSSLRALRVSILARLNGRALHCRRGCPPGRSSGFQSSPGLMAGRYRRERWLSAPVN